LVTRFHKKHKNEIRITSKTEAYTKSPILKKVSERISFEQARSLEEEDGHNEVDVLVCKVVQNFEQAKPA
jgi:hypothetical protein